MNIKVLTADDLIPDPEGGFMFPIEIEGETVLIHSSEVEWIDPDAV